VSSDLARSHLRLQVGLEGGRLARSAGTFVFRRSESSITLVNRNYIVNVLMNLLRGLVPAHNGTGGRSIARKSA
jgi:hypothetical protein